MREIKTHHVNGCNEAIVIEAVDGPGPGGASHIYDLRLPGWTREPVESGERVIAHRCLLLQFQNGPVKENGVGVNGITHEALLAVLIDRLQGFQAGPYKCQENAKALDHLQTALEWLNERTTRRDHAGIEGTMALDAQPRQESARDGRAEP